MALLTNDQIFEEKKVKTNIFVYVLTLSEYNCQSVQPSVKMSWIILAAEPASKLNLTGPLGNQLQRTLDSLSQGLRLRLTRIVG